MNNSKVCKFGGGAFLKPEGPDTFQKILDDDPDRKYFVFSALGSNGEKEDRTTQLLLQLANHKVQEQSVNGSIVDRLITKHEEIYPRSANIVRDTITKRLMEDLPPAALVALMKSTGEYIKTKLAANRYGLEFIDPREIIKVTGNYDKARILPLTYKLIAERLTGNSRFAIPGFSGQLENGHVATFEFGGSDTTGSIIARGVNASVYENWTESAIHAAHPNIVPHAHKIDEMTRRELRDLAYSGFNIIQDEAVLPLVGSAVKLHVRSMERYPERGTFVVGERVSDSNKPIVGVAYRDDLCSFRIEGYGLDNKTGILWKILRIFDNENRQVPVIFPPSGVDDISVVVEQGPVKNEVNEIKAELYELVGREGHKVHFLQDRGCMVVAGKGLARDDLIDGRIRIALGESGLKVVASNSGEGRRSILYALNKEDGPEAVRLVYNKFMK